MQSDLWKQWYDSDREKGKTKDGRARGTNYPTASHTDDGNDDMMTWYHSCKKIST
jgi:hypothetical protein